jgi:flagellar basal-body rod protein FlgF
MDKMLYVAMSGASQNTLALRAHANNLANVSTSGFRRDFEQARAMPVFGDGFPSRVYAMSERPATDFTSATLQETGNEAYVRTASLQIDALGQLRTSSGLPVLGNGGPIAVPPQEKVEIGEDGTITIRALGEAPNVLAEVDRLKLVNPDLRMMEKGQDGLIRYKGGEPLPADNNVRVTSGFLEASNVNAVEEMTAILSLSRQFELSVKMMRTAEDDAAAMARVLQLS